MLLEHWVWDGIYAKSVVFASSDVNKFTDKELKTKLEKKVSQKIGDFTVSRNEKYAFFNYDFETDE